MIIIEPKRRAKPYITPETHARLRHDHATWHPDVVERATRIQGPKLPFVNKSKFDSPVLIHDVIVRSYDHPAVLAPNGNHVVIFDMGHIVGWDGQANKPTSVVSVVIKPSGEVITTFPGRATV